MQKNHFGRGFVEGTWHAASYLPAVPMLQPKGSERKTVSFAMTRISSAQPNE